MTRLIDVDALDQAMYHKSFEVDDGRNVWNSGLWIRYKIYEEASREAPTVDAVNVIADAIKEMYEEESRSIESTDLIPLPFKSWLQRTTLRDFSEYLQEEKKK